MSKSNEELRKTRIYSGETGGDNRNQFQRDRDRVLYSSAFRRLGGVTQVVHVNTERGYHNRLTHSLKVAQVGRRLSEHLIANTDPTTIKDAGGLDESVVETACLAHDLGHPPFGHAAEEALQVKLEDDLNVQDSFEGNPQSFRIVNDVSIRQESYQSGGFKGLDLTLASLNAILKYPWSRETSGEKSKKWGYYSTERDEFDDVRSLRTPGSGDENVSLEAKIMDWADDLTYAIHDVVDFYKAGLIPLDELLRDTREREEFARAVDDDDNVDIPNRWDVTGFLDGALRNIGEVAGVQGATTNGSNNRLTTPFDNSSADIAALGFLSSELVERYLGLDQDVTVEVDPTIDGGLDIDDELKNEIEVLQYLSKYYVFQDSALVAQQHGHRELVKELFQTLFEATETDNYKHMIPAPFDEKIGMIETGEIGYDDIDDETLRARVIADLIASMTEQQAMELYERITGQSPGLVTDRIV